MSMSPIKRLILETMWIIDKPLKAQEIAKETGVGFPSVMMHLIGLGRMDCVMSPEKSFYVITEKGRKNIGFPEISKEKANEILAYQPVDRSFHFYVDLGKPLDVYASSFGDFAEKIQKVDINSIGFHSQRGDFEAWFTCLGDLEVARKMLLMREQNISGEELKSKLLEIVQKRFGQLNGIRSA